jgi:hypothetical protein
MPKGMARLIDVIAIHDARHRVILASIAVAIVSSLYEAMCVFRLTSL